MAKNVDCSELSMVLAKIALNWGARPEVKNLDDVTASIQQSHPAVTRQGIAQALADATRQPTRAMSETARKLGAIKHEARGDIALRNQIGDIEDHLRKQTLPTRKARPAAISETIERLRETRQALQKRLAKSDPALTQRLDKQIRELEAELNDANLTLPIKEADAPVSNQIGRLMYQRDRLRTDLNQKIRDMKPKPLSRRVAGKFNVLKGIKASTDFSAVARQGGFILFGHPLRAAKSLAPMFKAFASAQAAHEQMQEILGRYNAPFYRRYKLQLSPIDGTYSPDVQEEYFMSDLTRHIPLLDRSARAFTVFINTLRADSFDDMVENLTIDGEPTTAQGQAIANFINVATGRGNLGMLERAAEGLNTVFFAPRYVASRFQLLTFQPLRYGKGVGPEVRLMIAMEYARYLAGISTVYGLGLAAGGRLEDDPTSSDFGKIRFGNTRLDPLSGLSQTVVLTQRLMWREYKSSTTGKITPMIGPGRPYKGPGVKDTIYDFMDGKITPAFSIALKHWGREQIGGEPVKLRQLPWDLLAPLAFEDIYEAMLEQGVPTGAALGTLAIFGMGLGTYESRAKGRGLPGMTPPRIQIPKPGL